MITAYIAEAMGRATYRILEDGTYFGEICELPGVWSSEESLEKCRQILQEVLEDWLLLKLRSNEDIPPLGEVSLVQKGS